MTQEFNPLVAHHELRAEIAALKDEVARLAALVQPGFQIVGEATPIMQVFPVGSAEPLQFRSGSAGHR